MYRVRIYAGGPDARLGRASLVTLLLPLVSCPGLMILMLVRPIVLHDALVVNSSSLLPLSRLEAL